MRKAIHFPDLPFQLIMPASSNNIRDVAFKTIPSVSKTEIKKVLESACGFEVKKVRTLNMKGKKKKIGRAIIAKPDYKKAYVTLKNPSSISSFPYCNYLREDEKKKNEK